MIENYERENSRTTLTYSALRFSRSLAGSGISKPALTWALPEIMLGGRQPPNLGKFMNVMRVKTSCVMMTGPDDQMDQVGDRRKPANTLQVKCKHCTFPDLDLVGNPYLLGKGISSPAETSPARLGNFLVRERVRQILQLVVPDACTFHPTADVKSKKAAPWWLAVPIVRLKTEMPKAEPPFCPKCGEPKVWGPLMGPVWDRMKNYNSGGVDIFKSESWFSRITAEEAFEQTNKYRKQNGEPPLPWNYSDVEPPSHAERWTRTALDRELYFSVRLEQLFKRVKVKGQLVRLLIFNEVKLSTGTWLGSRKRLSCWPSMAWRMQ